MNWRPLLTLFAAGLAGCVERAMPVQLEPPPVRPGEVIAFLAASATEVPDEYLVRAIARHGVALEEAGSVVAAVVGIADGALLGDASRSNALRQMAALAGRVRIAAASSEGLNGGELFTLRVRAARSADINALRLEISDLNDRSGASLRQRVRILPYVTWGAQP